MLIGNGLVWVLVIGGALFGLVAVVVFNTAVALIPGIGAYLVPRDDEEPPLANNTLALLTAPVRLVLSFAVFIVPIALVVSVWGSSTTVNIIESINDDLIFKKRQAYSDSDIFGLAGVLRSLGVGAKLDGIDGDAIEAADRAAKEKDGGMVVFNALPRPLVHSYAIYVPNNLQAMMVAMGFDEGAYEKRIAKLQESYEANYYLLEAKALTAISVPANLYLGCAHEPPSDDEFAVGRDEFHVWITETDPDTCEPSS